MDLDFLCDDQFLLPPSNDKHNRSFSTSTPFVQVREDKIRSFSISISCSSQNDSGLGASITDVSVSSSADKTQTYPSVTVSVCKTPTKGGEYLSFSTHLLNQCISPVSTKRFSFRRLESEFNSRRMFLAHRSLNSCLSPKNSSDSGDNTLNTDESRLIRNFNNSFVRKLNLDLDIYDCNESLHEDFRSGKKTHKEHELASQFEQILQKFTPTESDRLIGRKMGQEKVDILSELNNRNISCVSIILSYLKPEDLCSMSLVSQQWKSVCKADKHADQRRRIHLRRWREARRKLGKENAVKRTVTPQTRAEAVPLQNLPVLQTCVDTPSRNDVKTTTEQFMAVASELKNDEKLQKCPRCRKPAIVLPVQDRGTCQNQDCNFDFCTKCLCEFHGSTECAPIVTKKTKTDAIGTQRSKKNLKRL